MLEPKDIIYGNVRKILRDEVNGPLPAKIVSVADYTNDQTVDVQVLVNRLYTNGKIGTMETTTLYGVPFMNPSSGGASITFPPKEGDEVLLVFSGRDITNYKLAEKGEQVNARTSRHCDLNDAIAMPGLNTTRSHSKPSSDNFEIKFNDTKISITPDGGVTITADNIKMEATNVDINGTTIDAAGKVVSPVGVEAPSVKAGGVEVTLHTHTIPSGSSSGPTLPLGS